MGALKINSVVTKAGAGGVAPQVVVSGGNSVGSVLTAAPGEGWAWTVGTWKRDGIALVTNLQYTRAKADIGKRLTFIPENPTPLLKVDDTVPGIPGSPTITAVTAGDSFVQVTFAAPADDGGGNISLYRLQLDNGAFTEGTQSPLKVAAQNGIKRTPVMFAKNESGWSLSSAPGASVTPSVPAPQSKSSAAVGASAVGSSPL